MRGWNELLGQWLVTANVEPLRARTHICWGYAVAYLPYMVVESSIEWKPEGNEMAEDKWWC